MKKAETENTATPKSTVSRGKYAHLLRAGSNIAVLAPDVVEHFPDSESVNNALRAFLAFGKHFASVIPPARRLVRRAAASASQAEFDPRKGTVKSKSLATK